jgi:hypothetical protein
MSIPVTSRSLLRNGVEDGHAPVQMPQLAHSAGITTACCRPGRPPTRARMTTAP